MIFLRSLAFNLAFYANTILQMLFWAPYFFIAPRKRAWFVPKFWARSSMWLQKILVGTRVDIRGLENLPAGSYILASKHQSFWDTFALLPHVADGLFILKHDLLRIPVFGWYIAKMNMIPVDRKKRSSALKFAVAAARERMKDSRQLIIYPEGTRRSPGAKPDYKFGVAKIYGDLNLPVIPVAHVAGLYWPRRRFLRYPGTIRVRFLPAIPPGLETSAFLAELADRIETVCDELLVEAANSALPPPLPPTAVARLRELAEKPATSALP